MADNRPYSISVGGFHLCKQGDIHQCEIGAAVRYDNMGAKHVQAFWRQLMSDPRLAAATAEFNAKVAPVLYELGNKYGLKKGRLKEADIKDIEGLQ